MGLDSFFPALLWSYGYIALVPGVIVMGPLAGLLAGVFARLGYFDFFTAYLFLLVGALIGDMLWYWAGRHWGEPLIGKFGRYVGITPGHVERAKGLFHRYHSPIIVLTKATNAFGLVIPVLFTAGLARIPFWRFLLLNLIGEVIWSGIMMSIGYYFSDLYLRVDDVLGRALIIGVSVMALVVGVGVGKYVRDRIYGEQQDTSA